MKTLKEQYYDIQRQYLSNYAQLDENSKGRKHPVSEDNIRGEYQRDRDRIIHSKAFRRLKHKTQVFLAPEGDHYRTRLTHTLEVAQIARTMARALHLNEDLTEAISLGHDLGHTPFGHAGESMLNELTKNCGGYVHSKQSRRVAELLENDGKGLNLTYEVLDGMENHKYNDQPLTLEGHIVKYADRFAYINHDIEDAIRGKILSEDDLPKDCCDILGHSKGERINTMIVDLINTCQGKNYIKQSDEILKATEKLHDYMFATVYLSKKAKPEEQKATEMLEQLFVYFIKNIDKLPDFYKILLESYPKERVVADYISSFTDLYSIKIYEELFVPKIWNI